MNSSSAVSIQAAQTAYAWLRALDPHERERAELTGQGVRVHTATALYPESFNALLPGLTAHLRTLDLRPLLSEQRQVEQTRLSLELANLDNTQPEAARKQLHTAWRLTFTDFSKLKNSARLLRDVINTQLAGGSSTELVAYSCASGLWHAWWYMSRCRLQTRVADPDRTAERAMHWFGVNLLQLPES